MCHHLFREELCAVYDMYYGTREAWWDEALVRQPQGFCRLAATANPALRLRKAERLDRLHRRVAELGPKEIPGGWILEELKRIMATRPGVDRRAAA